MAIRVPSGFVLLLATVFLAGCASSGVTGTKSTVANETILEPPRVIIGEFTASPDKIRPNSELAAHFEKRRTPVTAEELKLGRQLGGRVSAKLVEQLKDMGINALPQANAGPLGTNDALVEGYFVTVNEGSRLKRMLIGFGSGAAELRTLVQFYQERNGGLRDLGFAEIEAEGGKMPGMIVPLGIGAATDEVVRGAVVGGGVAVVKEVGPESIEAAANRTAEEISGFIKKAYEKRGWF